MNEKERVKDIEQETTPQAHHVKKQPPRYTRENKKVTPKLSELETGPVQRRSRGKKQRRQFKLAPNRG